MSYEFPNFCLFIRPSARASICSSVQSIIWVQIDIYLWNLVHMFSNNQLTLIAIFAQCKYCRSAKIGVIRQKNSYFLFNSILNSLWFFTFQYTVQKPINVPGYNFPRIVLLWPKIVQIEPKLFNPQFLLWNFYRKYWSTFQIFFIEIWKEFIRTLRDYTLPYLFYIRLTIMLSWQT